MAENTIKNHDLIVIGGGPGGYVAAIRAAQLGLDTACIDVNPLLGGTCLRVGCIPSKALLESSERYEEARKGLAEHGVVVGEVGLDLDKMMKRKERVVTTLARGIDGLLRKNKVTRYLGLGHFESTGPDGHVVVVARAASEGGDGEEAIRLVASRVIVATGSVAASLPGVAFAGDRVGTSTEALGWSAVPGEVVIIGAGAIGLELGSVWRRLGAQVTVLEYLDRILPGMDDELAALALKILKRQGLKFQLGARVESVAVADDRCTVAVAGSEAITCDRVLVAVGRKPNTEGLDLPAIGLAPDARGRVEVDAHFETRVAGVYAIGDVIAGPMLAHKAEEDGVACVEQMVTGYGHVDYDLVPMVVYTEPEVAAVGQTEAALTAAGRAYRKGSFAFAGNGRARSLGATDGFVKILADAQTDRVLGVHLIGTRVSELVAEVAAAMAFGASSEDLARTCHAHPTLAEVIKEAALAVDGRAIHA